jgi:hypothetical protein
VHGKTPPSEPAGVTSAKSERVVIRQRKKEPETRGESEYKEPGTYKGPYRQEEFESAIEMEKISAVLPPEEIKIGTKERPARDDIFFGKSVSLKEPLRVKDGALLHTEIKTKKVRPGSETEKPTEEGQETTSQSPKKKSGKLSLHSDD